MTAWFTDEAVGAWAAEPRTTRGGQPWCSALAILAALTLRAVSRLAYRRAEGLIGSVVGLLGLALRGPDHTTLSRRAATLEVPRPRPRPGSDAGGRGDAEPLHPLVGSTGLKLRGAGEWSVEKHGTRPRRSWRKLHLGVDADTGRIVASALTGHDADDGTQVDLLLDRVEGRVASFTGDGAYDQASVYDSVAERHPRSGRDHTAAPHGGAQRHGRDRTHPTRPPPRCVAEHGRMGWQKRSGYNRRSKAEAAVARWKQVTGEGLRSRADERRATGVAVAAHALNRMLELGRPSYVRIA